MPASRADAHATPPSWKAKRRFGNRLGTPPKTSERHVPSSAAAKLPTWLYELLVVDIRVPHPCPPEWNVGATPSSSHRRHNGS